MQVPTHAKINLLSAIHFICYETKRKLVGTSCSRHIANSIHLFRNNQNLCPNCIPLSIAADHVYRDGNGSSVLCPGHSHLSMLSTITGSTAITLNFETDHALPIRKFPQPDSSINFTEPKKPEFIPDKIPDVSPLAPAAVKIEMNKIKDNLAQDIEKDHITLEAGMSINLCKSYTRPHKPKLVETSMKTTTVRRCDLTQEGICDALMKRNANPPVLSRVRSNETFIVNLSLIHI